MALISPSQPAKRRLAAVAVWAAAPEVSVEELQVEV